MPLSREELLLLVQLVPIAMFCLILLATLGAPGIAVVSEQLATLRNRVFYDKFGLQIANMSLRFGLLGLILVSAATAFYYSRNPDFYPANILPLFLACAAALALFMVQIYLYNFSWKPMREMKGPHKMLGATAQVLGMALIVLVLATKRFVLATLFHAPQLVTVELFRTALLLPPTSALWPMAVQMIVFSIAAAGAVGLVYLLLRRRLEDYGRDYYNFCLRYCAKWALFPGLAQIAAFGWLAWTIRALTGALSIQNPLAVLIFGAAGLWFLACILFLFVARSQNPLRLKATIAGAFVLMAAGLACQGMLFYKLLPVLPAYLFM